MNMELVVAMVGEVEGTLCGLALFQYLFLGHFQEIAGLHLADSDCEGLGDLGFSPVH